MKAAVISIGVIGKVHLEVLARLNIRVTAVCDTDESKIKDLQGVEKYADYKKMIDEADFDVVHICAPHYLHAEMIVYALKKNKNVLCEKPLCISYKEIDDILEAERNSRGILGVCLQNRYNISSIAVKEYLKDKKVRSAHGSVSWKRDESYYKSGEWRGKKSTEGGGVLINQALHTLDLMQWLCGFPSEVYANCENYLHKKVIDVEDTVSAVFKGEANFDFFATTCASSDLPVMIELKTENDTVLLLPDCAIVNGKTLALDDNHTFFGKCDYGHGHNSLIKDFYSCVERGEKFWINGEECAKVMKLIFAVYESNGEKAIV